MVNVFLLLGSNLGDRNLFLQQAIDAIEQNFCPTLKRSAVYETQSWGRSDQPDYLNQVVEIATDKPAREVLNIVLGIEQQLGRKRNEKWGSRTIDIDILFYGDEVINEPGLIVPHPELHNRRFAIEPLVEIAPFIRHSVLKKSMLALKNELTDTLNIKKL